MRNINVVAGIIYNKNGEILLAQRKEDDYPPLKWEFPGGKIEKDENYFDALKREIEEEFEIKIVPEKLIAIVNYYYEDRDLKIKFFVVSAKSENDKILHLHAHNEFKWLSIQDVKKLDLADADREILKIAEVYDKEKNKDFASL